MTYNLIKTLNDEIIKEVEIIFLKSKIEYYQDKFSFANLDIKETQKVRKITYDQIKVKYDPTLRKN